MISAAIGGNVLGRGNYRKSLSFDLDAPRRAALCALDGATIPCPLAFPRIMGLPDMSLKTLFPFTGAVASRAPEKPKVRHYLRKHWQRDSNYSDFLHDERLFRVISRIAYQDLQGNASVFPNKWN